MDWFDFSLKLPITDPTWIFLLVLLIILFAPILLNKLRIPHIIGMILAGLVLHYVPCRSGNEYGRLQTEPGQSACSGALGFYCAHRHRLGNEYSFVEVRGTDLCPTGKYVCIAYTGGLSHRDSLRCVAASQCEYCSGGDGGYGYTHFAGSGRCGWYVQGGVGRLLLGMACHKGYLPGYFDCISVSTHRSLVLPEVR